MEEQAEAGSQEHPMLNGGKQHAYRRRPTAGTCQWHLLIARAMIDVWG